MKNKKLFMILAGVGAVLTVGGLAIQGIAAANEDFQSVSSLMSMMGLGKLCPETVGKLLKDGVNLGYGMRMSIQDALRSYTSNAGQTLAALKLYAATPAMIWGGVVGMAAGVAAALFGKQKARA